MENTKLVSPPEAHYTVYKLTSPENKVYIGCTGQKVERRWSAGKRYWSHVPIGVAIGKFGWENFRKEILCEKLTKEGAEKLEAWFIDYYDSMNPEKGYNCCSGGCRTGSHLCKESIERIRNSYIRKILYSETRYNQVSVKQYYRDHPERRKEISEQMHEYLLSPAGRKFAKSCTRPKPVRCVETGRVYPSARNAEKEIGLCGVHKACSGKQVLCGGCHWEYVH